VLKVAALADTMMHGHTVGNDMLPGINDHVVDVDAEVGRHVPMIPHVGLPLVLHRRQLAFPMPFLTSRIAPMLCCAVTCAETGRRPPRFALRPRPLPLARPPHEG
jgi:hypothetical protein